MVTRLLRATAFGRMPMAMRMTRIGGGVVSDP
jgi:hypothetical protein